MHPQSQYIRKCCILCYFNLVLFDILLIKVQREEKGINKKIYIPLPSVQLPGLLLTSHHTKNSKFLSLGAGLQGIFYCFVCFSESSIFSQ